MKKIIFLTVAILFAFSVQAQENQEQTNNNNVELKKGSFSLHFGPTFPLADFSDDDIYNSEDALGAAVGVGAGIEYSYPLNSSGLGVFLGFDVNYNWYKSDVRDDIEEEFENIGLDDDDLTLNRYFNIPISAGLNYTFKADDKLSIYGNFGLVANFFKITNLTAEVLDEEVVTEYDLSTKIGVEFGGGVIINNKTIISLNYFGLGKHKIKSTTNSTVGSDYEVDWKSKVNYLTLTVGFKL